MECANKCRKFCALRIWEQFYCLPLSMEPALKCPSKLILCILRLITSHTKREHTGKQITNFLPFHARTAFCGIEFGVLLLWSKIPFGRNMSSDCTRTHHIDHCFFFTVATTNMVSSYRRKTVQLSTNEPESIVHCRKTCINAINISAYFVFITHINPTINR